MPQTTKRAELRVVRRPPTAHLFVVNGSRLYDIEPEMADQIEAWLKEDATRITDLEGEVAHILGLFAQDRQPRYIDHQPLEPPPLYSISLNVAQACNMSCGYCYADAGKFGGKARMMNVDVACATVDRLLSESSPGADIVLGYMGGEPLLNRELVHTTTRYAVQAAKRVGKQIRFSITTNATLMQPEDAELFSEYPFTVVVSVDGNREQHNAIRVMNNATGSYDRMLMGLSILQRYGRPRHLSARITVTPRTGELLPILDHIIDLGFDEVGFAAVLVSAAPQLAFSRDDFPLFLQRMIACGNKALREIGRGKKYPFGNFETAMQQIHRGTHRPYPCGAGAAYLSANAEGKLFACHRLIDDPQYAMGDVDHGSDRQKRFMHLTRNHVDQMEPCNTCWARYLCGGGCYHEVARRGRLGCDYIRGWLDFCLQAYAELSSLRPGYFSSPETCFREMTSTSTTVFL